MANYQNYPEYEMFEEELDRKKNLLNSTIENYELLQRRVKDMQGYEQIEIYIKEMEDVYNLLIESRDLVESSKSKLIYS